MLFLFCFQKEKPKRIFTHDLQIFLRNILPKDILCVSSQFRRIYKNTVYEKIYNIDSTITRSLASMKCIHEFIISWLMDTGSPERSDRGKYSLSITHTKSRRLYGLVFGVERRKNIFMKTYNFWDMKWDIQILYLARVMVEYEFFLL